MQVFEGEIMPIIKQQFDSLKKFAINHKCEGRIKPLVNLINSFDEFCTVDSCEGHFIGEVDINYFKSYNFAYVAFISINDDLVEKFMSSLIYEVSSYDIGIIRCFCELDYITEGRTFYTKYGIVNQLLKTWKIEFKGLTRFGKKDGDKLIKDIIDYLYITIPKVYFLNKNKDFKEIKASG